MTGGELWGRKGSMACKKGQVLNPKGHPATLVPGPKPKKVPEPLLSMRWVTEHVAEEDDTDWKRRCRVWMRDDPAGFSDALARHEAKFVEKKGKFVEGEGSVAGPSEGKGPTDSVGGGVVVKDVGVEEALRLIAEVLREGV